MTNKTFNKMLSWFTHGLNEKANVCMYLCTYEGMYVFMCVCLYVCICICM